MAASSEPARRSPVIVIGLLGGFVKHDDPIRSEVKLAGRLRTEYPWYDHAFAKTHMEIACDPQVWSQVEALIRRQIGANAR